jgi:hypothetical protein
MVLVRRYEVFDLDSEIYHRRHTLRLLTNWLLVRRYEIFDFYSEIFKGDTPYG